MKARSVSNKSIEHSISQKTELSKKNETERKGKAEKTVRHADTEKVKVQVSRTNPDNRPISETKSGRSVSTAKIHAVSATENKVEIQQPVRNQPQTNGLAAHKVNVVAKEQAAQKSNISPTGNSPPNNSVPLKTQIHKVSESKPTATPIKAKVITAKTETGIKTKPDTVIPTRPPEQFTLSKNVPKAKRYKVLKNGALDKGFLQKKKERIIYNKQQNGKLRKAVVKKVDNVKSEASKHVSQKLPNGKKSL